MPYIYLNEIVICWRFFDFQKKKKEKFLSRKRYIIFLSIQIDEACVVFCKERSINMPHMFRVLFSEVENWNMWYSILNLYLNWGLFFFSLIVSEGTEFLIIFFFNRFPNREEKNIQTMRVWPLRKLALSS